MKKAVLFLLMFAAISQIIAQTQGSEKSAKYKKYERSIKYTRGHIISRSGDKVKGLIKMKSGEARQFSSVKFMHYSGDIISYYPSQVKGFGYYSKNFESIDDSFYEVIRSGKKVDLLRNVSLKIGPGLMLGIAGAGAGSFSPSMNISENETMYLRNNQSNELTKVRKINFKALCLEYFSECQSVVDKIDSREYKFRDLDKIVKTFNYCPAED